MKSQLPERRRFRLHLVVLPAPLKHLCSPSILNQVLRIHPLRGLKGRPPDQQVRGTRQDFVTAVGADDLEGAFLSINSRVENERRTNVKHCLWAPQPCHTSAPRTSVAMEGDDGHHSTDYLAGAIGRVG
jgi:hypothetical protein